LNQGDPIGLIFAYKAILYFGQFFENFERRTHILATFSQKKFCINFDKNKDFGNFCMIFSQDNLDALGRTVGNRVSEAEIQRDQMRV
jgi:hypothetical protein